MASPCGPLAVTRRAGGREESSRPLRRRVDAAFHYAKEGSLAILELASENRSRLFSVDRPSKDVAQSCRVAPASLYQVPSMRSIFGS
jgi:hypothetical protein